MGTIKQGILGGFSGKVGAVVGSSWKGIATMRAKPLSVLNPRTAAQVANRLSFGSISILAADCLTTIVKPLNDRFAQKMSGYNAFCSRSKMAFDGSGSFVPEELYISSGKLGDAVITSTNYPSPGVVEVNFPTAPSGAYEQPTDKVFAMVVDQDGKVRATSSGVVTRAVGSIEFTLDVTVALVAAFVYLSFIRVDGSIVSNSAMSPVAV